MRKVLSFAVIASMALVSCGEVATAVERGVGVGYECPVVEECTFTTPTGSVEAEVMEIAENSEAVPHQIAEIGQPLDDLYEITVWGENGCELEHYTIYGV